MAYKVKKSSNIIEDLELLNDNDEVEKTIHVEVNVERIATDFRKTQIALFEAQKAVNSKADNALESFGNAVISMFQLIFGGQNTAELIAYFDGKYTEMSIQIMPFIAEVVKPAIEKHVQSKKSMLANNYNLSKTQKKRLGL